MLDLDLDGPVATLTLNRPKSRNALSPELLTELTLRCDDLAADDEVRVVLLRGADGVFSAGADLLAFGPLLATEGVTAADLGRQAVDALASMPQVTIAFIEGACVGGGMVLAAACDLRLAHSDAQFWAPEVEAGIPVAWGGMAVLRRVVGEARLLELVLLGRRLSTDEALACGFVSQRAGAADAAEVARRLAALPASTLRAVKRQVLDLRAGTFDADHDAVDLVAAMADPDVIASMQAYLLERLHRS